MMKKMIGALALSILLSPSAFSQRVVSMDEAILLALERNPAVHAGKLAIRQQEALKGAVIDLPQTEVSLLYGQYNSIHKNDNNITVSQTIPFPTLFTSGSQLVKSRVAQATTEARLTESELTARVRRKFNEVLYLRERTALLKSQDSVFRELVRVARVRYETGEGTQIEVTAAEAQLMQVVNAIERNRIDFEVVLQQLSMLCLSDNIADVSGTLRELFPATLSDSVEIGNNPQVRVQQQRALVAHDERRFEIAKSMPSLTLGFFSQTLIGSQLVNGVETQFDERDRFHGIQVGVSVPLFFNAANARVKATRYAADAADKAHANLSILIEQEFLATRETIRKNRMSVTYFEETGLRHADLLVNQARRSFQEGEVEYGMLLLNLRQAITIREEYLSTLYELNDNLISLLVLTDK